MSQHQEYWSDYSLSGIEINARPFDKDNFCTGPDRVPPHFWNDYHKKRKADFPIHRGYSEARNLIGRGTVSDIENLSVRARSIIFEVFSNIEDNGHDKLTPSRMVKLRLSSELERWKDNENAAGRILPPKKPGLTKVSDEVLNIFGATNWPEALQTNNALFGVGISNLLTGAIDSTTMFSNYVTDMLFYFEHGYDHVFPSLESLLERGLSDPYALKTPGGNERRACIKINSRYVQGKINLEKSHKSDLAYRTVRMSRLDAQILSFSESSLVGLAAEAIARGFEPAGAFSDLVYSSPGTDVVDVGSDLLNSEVMNSFLNTKDITATGVVSEDALRRVYDAFAAVGARTLTERWHEPVARMCALLYTWHIQNDRHAFLRRAVLGWPRARKAPAKPQREADFDEAFDEQFHTTGFSRPLDAKYECNGRETCDHVCDFLARNNDEALLRDLWRILVVGVLEYVRGGRVDEEREKTIEDESRLTMARLYSRGLVLEMIWLIAHANHHAWQVNYLFEAAMFGSVLDGGELIGKLDRTEEQDLVN